MNPDSRDFDHDDAADHGINHDRTDLGRSRADGADADEVPAATTAVQQEQQEQAQAVVDALADRIRHASGAAGLMELAADALAEIAETFGAVIDVEHLRAALVRHWP